MPSNPYRAGNPVGGSPAFIGREDILRGVLRVLASSHENAIVLYGQRRIGKTSVLMELVERLAAAGPYRPVYFDLQDKAARPLAEVLNELAQRIAGKLELPAPERWADDAPRRFREEFLPQVLERLPAESSLVLLFDEFDVLDGPAENQAAAAFFPYLRDLLTFNPRLQFVFVIGRRPDELSTLTLSVFKGVSSERISLLDEAETTRLVRLSEPESLGWSDEAVAHIYQLTGGHPFLTQQLCQEIWEEANDDSDSLLFIAVDVVDAAVPAALRSATNALEWLWNGLVPAARIVASALAGAGTGSISQTELERRLQESSIRMLIGELRDAPRTLQEWDLIEPSNGGYRFRVEMLRRWIAENKPLSRVQEEIDYVQPAAESLFQVAYALYQSGQLTESLGDLRRVVRLNPNHLRGSQLLAELLIADNQLDEAGSLLEQLYQRSPATARSRLLQVLLLQAQSAADKSTQLALYQRVLELEPGEMEATNFFFARRRAQVDDLDATGDYRAALDAARQLANDFPDRQEQLADIVQLEYKTHLADLYRQAEDAAETDNRADSIPLLVEILLSQPDYRQTTQLLHMVVTGEDINALKAALSAEQKVGERAKIEAKQKQAATEAEYQEKLEKETATRQPLQDQLATEQKQHAQVEANLQAKLKTETQLREAAEKKANDESRMRRKVVAEQANRRR